MTNYSCLTRPHELRCHETCAVRHQVTSIQFVSKLPSQLTSLELERWQTLRQGSTALADPFFSPEFFQVLEQVRPNTEIAVIRQGETVVGFLPLERYGCVARPAAALVNGIDGSICSEELDWAPQEMLDSLKLRAWEFSSLPAAQVATRDHHIQVRNFSYIDLSLGLNNYVAERKAAGSQQIEKVARRRKKLVREHGTLDCSWNDVSPTTLETLLRWKSAQYQRTGTRDVLGAAWVVDLLGRLREFHGRDLHATVPAIHCRGKLLAAAYCLVSGEVLSCWFPAYNGEFGKYSPGSILLLMILEEAAKHGITRIHLGQGNERYKKSFANGGFRVAEGAVDRSPWRQALRFAWVHTRDWAASKPFCATPLRGLRSIRYRLFPT